MSYFSDPKAPFNCALSGRESKTIKTNTAEKFYNFKGENLLLIYVHILKTLGIEQIWMQK